MLAGMPETLANPGLKAIITETNDTSTRYEDADRSQVSQVMADHGFAPHSYDPFSRKIMQGDGP